MAADTTDTTDVHPAFPGGPDEAAAAHDRWQRAWSHREQLLKVARRRSMSVEDAEDAVHEAMLRAAENPHLDDERLGAWLTTVTMRLCVDRYRQVNREAEVVRSSPTLVAAGPVPVEEAVCDRAEAKWLAVRSGELPARQAEALWLKSEDLDVGQVAMRMGLSYRTVESLLARARRTLRASLAGTLGLALWLCGRGRPRTGGNAQAVAMASTAATLVVAAGFVLPYVHDGERSRPVPPATSGSAGMREPVLGGVPPAATRGKREAPAAAGAGATAEPEALQSPAGVQEVLPELTLPSLPAVSGPSVPPVPAPVSVPSLQVDVPDIPDAPETSDAPNPPDMVEPSLPPHTDIHP